MFVLEAILDGLGRMEALNVTVHLPEEPAPHQSYPVVVTHPDDVGDLPQIFPALVQVLLDLL